MFLNETLSEAPASRFVATYFREESTGMEQERERKART